MIIVRSFLNELNFVARVAAIIFSLIADYYNSLLQGWYTF